MQDPVSYTVHSFLLTRRSELDKVLLVILIITRKAFTIILADTNDIENLTS